MLSYGQDFNDKESWQLLITDKDSILYKGFQLEELQKNNFIENSISYDFENKLIYTPTYSDTIYQFCENISFIPKFVIKQNKSIIGMSGINDYSIVRQIVIMLYHKRIFKYHPNHSLFCSRHFANPYNESLPYPHKLQKFFL